MRTSKHEVFDNTYEHFDLDTLKGNSYRGQDGHRPAASRKEQERQKMCRLVIIECGVRLRRVGNGYVKRNQKVN